VRTLRVPATAVVFDVDGVAGLKHVTAITNNVEELISQMWNFRLDGCGFTRIDIASTKKVQVAESKIGSQYSGIHHIS
jgi:hypothetical protein